MELRTPIEPILGLTEVIRSKLADRKEEAELLNVISRNAKRLHQLTEIYWILRELKVTRYS
jgi:two-component system, OmpR family, sensor histidine kinase VicK